jgi:ankyrin repeat protein
MPEQEDIHILVRRNEKDAVAGMLYTNPSCLERQRVRDGMTPLMAAVDTGNLEMVDLLLTYKPSVLTTTKQTLWTVFHIAANHDFVEILQNLYTYGLKELESKQDTENVALLDIPDKDGMTPLMVSCVAGHVSMVKLLVENYHVNFMANNALGDTPLHLACYWGHIEVVQYFLGGGDATPTGPIKVDLRAYNKQGNQPAHRACYRGHYDIANLLALRGANMLAVNNEGLTPIDVSPVETIKGFT